MKSSNRISRDNGRDRDRDPHRNRARERDAEAPNPWGAPSAVVAPVNLHDVMDEELAAKLQREEEEEWEREMARRLGDEKKGGWCLVEVPGSSADGGCGTVSVMEQDIGLEDMGEDCANDDDYALALELQAQEADEYDRLRRQEASSIERIQVIEQERPKPRQLCDFIGSAALKPKRTGRGPGRHGTMATLGHSQTLPDAPRAQMWARTDSGTLSLSTDDEAGISFTSEDGLSMGIGLGLQEDKTSDVPDSEAATFDEDEQDDDEFDDDALYLEDDCGMPIRKFHSLHLSLRGFDPEHCVPLAMPQ